MDISSHYHSKAGRVHRALTLYLFIIGNIVTLASPAVVPALGPSAAYIGAAVIVFECVILSSVFFLRWKGMKELKGKML